MAENKNSIILGIGNMVLSDSGAGMKTIRYLQRHYADLESIAHVEAAGLSYTLMPKLENTDTLIIFDAARLDKRPGTVTCLQGIQMDRFLRQPKRTLNEMALADILNMVQLNECCPAHRALIAIEPKKTNWGKRLSSPVSRAIPKAAQHALTLLTQWTGYRPAQDAASTMNG
jgi:hydrogenase maturation protease